MKLVKSLLLGSAAGLTAVAGAQAADLPIRKAAPVEYVRVCTAYGAGFFYIPGTDTCLKLGGFARWEYQYTQSRALRPDLTGMRSTGRLIMDARTDTAYGTLRTFIRMDIRASSGAYLNSGTQVRMGTQLLATGIDTAGRTGTQVDVDKAFIQFAGFTAGRAASFFDFYAHAHEMIGASFGSDISTTNLLAYTATFGGGFSATLAIEDPIWRRQPIYTNGGAAGGFVAGALTAQAGGAILAPLTGILNPQAGTLLGFQQITSIPFAFNAAGNPVLYRNLDIAQRNRMPDVVGNLRLDQPWGSAQISGAIHEISTGGYQGGVFSTGLGVAGAAIPGFPGIAPAGAANTPVAGIIAPLKVPDAKYGAAIQGGVKLNLPMLAAGDALYLQAAYTKGAIRYACVYCWNGSENTTYTMSGRYNINTNDAVVDANQNLKLTESWSAVASFRHFFTPTISAAITGSIGQINYPSGARFGVGPFNGVTLFPATAAVPATVNAFAFNSTLRSVTAYQIGGNVNWTPVKGLDIGLEAVYNRAKLHNGQAADLTRFGATGGAAFGLPAGVPAVTTANDDAFMTRFRVQREF